MARHLKFQEALKVVTEALKNDPEHWEAWKANISMPFQDAYLNTAKMSKIHSRAFIKQIADRGAEQFLNILCKD